MITKLLKEIDKMRLMDVMPDWLDVYKVVSNKIGGGYEALNQYFVYDDNGGIVKNAHPKKILECANGEYTAGFHSFTRPEAALKYLFMVLSDMPEKAVFWAREFISYLDSPYAKVPAPNLGRTYMEFPIPIKCIIKKEWIEAIGRDVSGEIVVVTQQLFVPRCGEYEPAHKKIIEMSPLKITEPVDINIKVEEKDLASISTSMPISIQEEIEALV